MDAVGVVCEFDPLHRGHERLLRRAGESGRVLVCAMSGNFTQRGSAACVEKFARAEMAVRCGADLVVELPTPWAMATAEKFADGGVSLLAQCGVKTLYFGSECGDTDALWATAEALLRADVHRAIRLEMDGGLPYAAARQAVLERETGLGALLAQPNNTLAVEYLKAIRRRGLAAEAATVRREDGGHHGSASASHIRALLAAGQEAKAFALMPPQAADILGREMKKGLAPVDPARLERAMLARLRLMNEHDFASYDSGGEGLAGVSGGTGGRQPGGYSDPGHHQALPHRPGAADAVGGIPGPGGARRGHPLCPNSGRHRGGAKAPAADAGRRCAGADQGGGCGPIGPIGRGTLHPGGPPDGCIRPGMPRLPPPLRQ